MARKGKTPGPVTTPQKDGVGKNIASPGKKQATPTTTPNKKGVGKSVGARGRVKGSKTA